MSATRETSGARTSKKPHGVFRHACPTCGYYFQARNLNRHRKACLRRKRDAMRDHPLFEPRPAARQRRRSAD